MLTTTLPFVPTRLRAARMRLKWPSCKYPIVGTKPMHPPARCHFLASRCIAAAEETICMTEKLPAKRSQSMQLSAEKFGLTGRSDPSIKGGTRCRASHFENKSRTDCSTRLVAAGLLTAETQRRSQSAATNLPAHKIQRRALRHFVGARLVDRRVGCAVVGRHDFVRENPRFDFLAADVGQHLAVDLDARAQHLAALLDHFLALQRVVDDVAVLERQVVFAQHGADALAPAADRFQIGNNFWFVHGNTVPHPKAQGKFFSQAKNLFSHG